VSATLGWVGLGAMGSRLASRLLAAGHAVVGWNRTPDKARALAGAGLRPGASPRAVAEAAEAVFSMVTDDAALRAVALGPDGIVAGLHPGAVFVEMSTVGPAVTREVGAAVAHGWRPVTLGRRTLRADAVPVAAIAVLQFCWNDL